MINKRSTRSNNKDLTNEKLKKHSIQSEIMITRLKDVAILLANLKTNNALSSATVTSLIIKSGPERAKETKNDINIQPILNNTQLTTRSSMKTQLRNLTTLLRSKSGKKTCIKKKKDDLTINTATIISINTVAKTVNLNNLQICNNSTENYITNNVFKANFKSTKIPQDIIISAGTTYFKVVAIRIVGFWESG